MKGYAFDNGVPPSGTTKGVLGIRPEHVAIHDDAARMPFTFDGEIDIVEPMGSDTVAWIKLAGQSFTFRCESEVVLQVGQRIRLGFDPARGSLFSADTGDRL
jgi:multiple sugar transport system ATP-binding protein